MAMSFIKRGKESQKQIETAEVMTELRKSGAGDAYKYRFWMREGEEKVITFLDGGLDEDGVLDEGTFWEHQVTIGADFNNYFPCLLTPDEPQKKCPLCEEQNSRSVIGVFTIIDHSEYKDKTGAIRKNQKKLYACKRDTLKQLRKKALKMEGNGLVGCTFEVGRIGDKSAKVGNEFDLLKQWDDMNEFRAKYGLDDTKPFDYDTVVKYRTDEELRALGFGAHSIGSAKGSPTIGDNDL